MIAGLSDSDWARNARATGWGLLSRGRRTTRMTLREVTDPAEQRRVLRAFPTEVPHGVDFFVRTGVVPGPTPDDFEQGAGALRDLRARPGLSADGLSPTPG